MDNQAHYRIHISKLNEVYLKIECDNPGICYELVQYFTFEVPGHKFMPAYRNKMWDGKIRLFSDKTGKIYVGLLDYIKEFCDRNEISYDIDDNVNDTKDVDRNNPHSLSIFEKKIKSLCREMKDKVLGKYYLDSFLTKIKEFTPNLNYKKNNFIKFNKSVNPLQKTKEIYKHRNKFEEKDLKELSILFLASPV